MTRVNLLPGKAAWVHPAVTRYPNDLEPGEVPPYSENTSESPPHVVAGRLMAERGWVYGVDGDEDTVVHEHRWKNATHRVCTECGGHAFPEDVGPELPKETDWCRVHRAVRCEKTPGNSSDGRHCVKHEDGWCDFSPEPQATPEPEARSQKTIAEVNGEPIPDEEVDRAVEDLELANDVLLVRKAMTGSLPDGDASVYARGREAFERIGDRYGDLRAKLELRTRERDEWRAAFEGAQLYPISEMEQKLAASEVKLEDAQARIAELERERDEAKAFGAKLQKNIDTNAFAAAADASVLQRRIHYLEGRVGELEAIKEKAHEWSAGFPLGGEMDAGAAADIYAACQALTPTTKDGDL